MGIKNWYRWKKQKYRQIKQQKEHERVWKARKMDAWVRANKKHTKWLKSKGIL